MVGVSKLLEWSRIDSSLIIMRYFNDGHDFSNEYQLFQDDAFECDSDFN